MRVGVIFPGQGSQVVGMGIDVARAYPAAAQTFAAAKTILGYDLRAVCEHGPQEKLTETRYAQPAIFVTNVALAKAVGDALDPVVSAGHSFGEYCSLVFGIAVRLFVRYGIALESHQQNAALVRGHLLVKDFDGSLVNYPRLVAALGPAAPGRAEFADQRLLTDSDDDLANVFITITVHLCAGAIAFGLAERGRAPLPVLISIVRKSLVAALDEYGGSPSAALLAARVLAAGRLPGKAMVTAGTLTEKSRTGASDINKYYGTTGPNYLR